MDFKDYYTLLGLPRHACAADVHQAYRRLTAQVNPLDISGQIDLDEAHAVLGDTVCRSAYDAVAAGHASGGPNVQSATGWPNAACPAAAIDRWDDFSEFFRSLFVPPPLVAEPSRRPRAQVKTQPLSRTSSPAAVTGADLHAKLVLTHDEARQGGARRLTLRAPQWSAKGAVSMAERTLDVVIPPDVRNGQLVRLSGHGEPGRHGGAAGDLYLELRLRVPAASGPGQSEQAVATSIGQSAEPPVPAAPTARAEPVDLPLAPWEAALGADVPVELPDGSAWQVHIPAGAQAGQVLTLQGMGLRGTPPRDIALQLHIVLPSAAEPRVRRLFEAMARELADFDARAAGPGLSIERRPQASGRR